MTQDNPERRILIENDDKAAAIFGQARECEVVALDTEFMRVKTYYAELCLLQLALPDGRAACLDPLAVRAPSLGEGLFGLNGTLVVHSAGQDLEVLESSLDYVPRDLFDTQIAAAFLGYGDQVSYSNLTRQLLGVELAKGETRTDWCRRPLTEAQLDYAYADVEHLLELQEILVAQLERDDKLQWVRRACAELVERRPQENDQSVVSRFKGGGNVPVSRQALLRELVLWRERTARQKNRPREWIVSSADLVAIATKMPNTPEKLASMTSLNAAQIRRYSNALVDLVNAWEGEASERVIWLPRGELDVAQKALLKQMQKRVRSFCERMSISPTALVSRADLEALLTGRPGRLDAGWRRELIGDVLEELL
ncbi:MAG: ribonuclease D [Proteobacteria bacterium]|nr:MAG: ribonuclease D [Pseudomonadota bacterium]